MFYLDSFVVFSRFVIDRFHCNDFVSSAKCDETLNKKVFACHEWWYGLEVLKPQEYEFCTWKFKTIQSEHCIKYKHCSDWIILEYDYEIFTRIYDHTNFEQEFVIVLQKKQQRPIRTLYQINILFWLDPFLSTSTQKSFLWVLWL